MNHDQQVQEIARQIKERIQDKKPVHISKGGVSHFVPLPNDPRRRHSLPIDISGLRNVIAIDAKELTCTAEPGLTFVDLVRETLKFGLVPCVVPELEGITVGGAVAGCSVESMSYRYGGFHDTCLEYEIVTGTGEILTCSRESHPLEFEMIHGSYGTLGVLTKVQFRLVRAKPFVKMTYRKFQNFTAFRAEMNRLCKSTEYDFIDGIIHNPNEFVLCLGEFKKEAPYLNDYRRMNIFYKSTNEKQEDYLTTLDYFFRYDTECHWLSKTVPPLEWRAFRFLFGKYTLGSTNLIKWSKRLSKVFGLKKRPDVVCDVFIPENKFGEFYEWYDSSFVFFPLWVIPYRIATPYGWINSELASRMKDDLFIDCAVYGKQNQHPTLDYSQLLEKKTFELNGIKTLISRNHYTKEEFWNVYNKTNYEKAKSSLDPNGVFPGLFEKFHKV